VKIGTLVVFREFYDTNTEEECVVMPLYTALHGLDISGEIRTNQLSIVVEEGIFQDCTCSKILTSAGNIGWIEDSFIEVKCGYV
jgi:hypothetical protein